MTGGQSTRNDPITGPAVQAAHVGLAGGGGGSGLEPPTLCSSHRLSRYSLAQNTLFKPLHVTAVSAGEENRNPGQPPPRLLALGSSDRGRSGAPGREPDLPPTAVSAPLARGWGPGQERTPGP